MESREGVQLVFLSSPSPFTYFLALLGILEVLSRFGHWNARFVKLRFGALDISTKAANKPQQRVRYAGIPS